MTDLLDGRYLLHERLGGGAYGTVFRAEQRVRGRTLRQVAVKVLSLDQDDPVADLFAETAQLMRLLERCPDPAVRDCFVTCYDAGFERGPVGRPFMVMELARSDLGGRFRGGQLPMATVRDIALSLCRGVAFLHREGLVHLDLKPGNVLVSPTGALRIGDFGMCAPVSRLLRRSSTPGGTLTYLPPEALQLRDTGPESDVYAIGLICYEMLTGRLPHQDQIVAAVGSGSGAPDIDALVRLKLREVEPPGRRNPEVRGTSLEAIVMRALDPLATARYPDAGAVLDALSGAPDEPDAEEAPTGPASEQQAARLVDAMGAALRQGSLSSAADLPRQALEAARSLPDSALSADLYLLASRVSLRLDDLPGARALAAEGLGRRRCPAAFRAMAEAYAGTELGRGFDRRSREEQG